MVKTRGSKKVKFALDKLDQSERKTERKTERKSERKTRRKRVSDFISNDDDYTDEEARKMVKNLFERNLDDDSDDSNYHEESEENEEYFLSDNQGLINSITRTLTIEYHRQRKEFNLKDVRKIAKSIVENADRDLIYDYAGSKPGDRKWKLSAKGNQSEIDYLESKLRNIRKYHEQTQIKMESILKKKIPKEILSEIIHKYDILQKLEPYTNEYREIEERIENLTKLSVVKFEDDPNHPQYQEYHSVLKESNDIKLDDIISSTLPISEKVKALDLFQILIRTDQYTMDYLDLKNRLITLLNSCGSMSQSELNQLQEKENALMSVLKTGESIIDLKRKILDLDADDNIRRSIFLHFKRMMRLDPTDQDYRAEREWIEWAVSLPYRKVKNHYFPSLPSVSSNKDSNKDIQRGNNRKGKKERKDKEKEFQDKRNSILAFCKEIRCRLDEHLYGMEKVKEHLMMIIMNRLTNPNGKGCIIGLEGPPGVGKTSVARALSAALSIPYEKISCAGITDPSLFKGDKDLYVGAKPNIFLQAMGRMGCSNGIILLDEIDKLGKIENGDSVEVSLLHALDQAHNDQFQDLYLNGIPHDLSRLWIICVFNSREKMSRPLLDRIQPIISVNSYNENEKIEIIENYIIPRTLKSLNFNHSIKFTHSGICELIRYQSNDDQRCEILDKSNGLRRLEDLINTIVSKINLIKWTGDSVINLKLSKINLGEKEEIINLTAKDVKVLLS